MIQHKEERDARVIATFIWASDLNKDISWLIMENGMESFIRI